MRLFALISTIVLLAGCSTNLDSDPSIPKAWVAINFYAQETFNGEIEHEPRGYLSKILIKERPFWCLVWPGSNFMGFQLNSDYRKNISAHPRS